MEEIQFPEKNLLHTAQVGTFVVVFPFWDGHFSSENLEVNNSQIVVF